MSLRTIAPSRLVGRMGAPPSKSYTHRAIVAAYLSGHRFEVTSPLESDDTRATATAVARLGGRWTRAPGRWTFHPDPRRRTRRAIEVDCRESGTTLRFVSALGALKAQPVRLRGIGRLGARPMGPLVEALRTLGATVRTERGRLPFTIHGPIHGGAVQLDASESSQFASALLLALPTCAEDSRLTLRGRVVSEPYLDATVATLRHLRVQVARTGRTFRIAGGQSTRVSQMAVPGDASSAAYFWVAAALTGGSVAISGVTNDWPQADRAILEVLRHAGARVREQARSITVRAGTPRPFSVDLTASPDLYPLAGVLAAGLPGLSRLWGAAHVVHKESNRRVETGRLARAFGARVRSTQEGLSIRGCNRLRPIDLPALTDHRMVMSAAVGALAASGPSRIGVAESVRKSYPGFWRDLRRLGAEVAIA